MINVFKIIRPSHISEVREQQASQMDEVCQVLSWSAMKYCMHQFSQYERFVEMLAGHDVRLKSKLRFSPVFRGFWNNEWAMRNEKEFLPFSGDVAFTKAWILEEYLFINDAERLINDDRFYNRFEHILKHI